MFSIPENIHFFNFAGMSPLPVRSQKVAREAALAKATPWALSVQDSFFDELDRLRTSFATLIGAKAADIALIPSATYGVTAAAHNLALQAGDEIIVQAEEFPALYYPLERRARETGARIVTARKKPGQSWTEAVLACFTPRTRALGVSPGHWTDGARLDLVEVGQRARAQGAVLIVDGCQWIGAAPFDLAAIDPDHLIVPTYKWMLGPYQMGFHYVSPRQQNGVPLEEYWASRAGADNFANLVDYTEHYEPGARRFDMSERSNLYTIPVAHESVKTILDFGVEQIANKLQQTIQKIADFAEDAGLEAPAKDERAPHMIGLRNPRGWPAGFADRLVQSGIYLSARGDCLRIAPHLNVGDRDLEALFAAFRSEATRTNG